MKQSVIMAVLIMSRYSDSSSLSNYHLEINSNPLETMFSDIVLVVIASVTICSSAKYGQCSAAFAAFNDVLYFGEHTRRDVNQRLGHDVDVKLYILPDKKLFKVSFLPILQGEAVIEKSMQCKDVLTELSTHINNGALDDCQRLMNAKDSLIKEIASGIVGVKYDDSTKGNKPFLCRFGVVAQRYGKCKTQSFKQLQATSAVELKKSRQVPGNCDQWVNLLRKMK
eukprot:534009_1